jgi:hypothetical protein
MILRKVTTHTIPFIIFSHPKKPCHLYDTRWIPGTKYPQRSEEKVDFLENRLKQIFSLMGKGFDTRSPH